ncbi:MAG: hypothetical protein C4K60_02725 [Ideonella sp. MAG2]|nr:MAG: hypothetical protein C4K60_02725 [Ideonella sp. MAG2]
MTPLRRCQANPLMRADQALWLRWDRLGIAVRCAYRPAWPQAVQLYLDAGQALVVAGLVSEAHMLRCSLRLLLQAARDEALPRSWRLACYAFTRRPVQQLQELSCWPHSEGDLALLLAGLEADLTLLCSPACAKALKRSHPGAQDAG